MRALATAALILFAAALAGVAGAASLRISPIGIELAPNQRAAALTVTNTDKRPVSIQVRVFRWTQDDGGDRLDPTTDLIVNPPAATIPAGAAYTVRIARPSVTPVDAERSYRLVIDELPRPSESGPASQGVAMLLRTSMPVFIGDHAQSASLAWTVWQDAQGLHAEASNTGRRHARVAGLALDAGDGRRIVFGEGLNGYVLAGAARRFDLRTAPNETPPRLAGATVVLTARDRDQQLRETLSVGTR